MIYAAGYFSVGFAMAGLILWALNSTWIDRTHADEASTLLEIRQMLVRPGLDLLFVLMVGMFWPAMVLAFVSRSFRNLVFRKFSV